MKKLKIKFNMGEKVEGTVTSVERLRVLIVNVQGHYLKVANETDQYFFIGQTVLLSVIKTDPLIFRFHGRASGLNVTA